MEDEELRAKLAEIEARLEALEQQGAEHRAVLAPYLAPPNPPPAEPE